jgi:hypothetical protein
MVGEKDKRIHLTLAGCLRSVGSFCQRWAPKKPNCELKSARWDDDDSCKPDDRSTKESRIDGYLTISIGFWSRANNCFLIHTSEIFGSNSTSWSCCFGHETDENGKADQYPHENYLPLTVKKLRVIRAVLWVSQPSEKKPWSVQA